MFTFDPTPTYQSDGKFELAVSDDKRPMKLTIPDLQVTVGNDKSPAPMSTRSFSLVLPLQGVDKRVEIEFVVQGYTLTTEGASASMICSLNGQTTVADFPGRSNQSFEQKIEFAAETPSECRLCVFLLVERDSKSPEAAAYLSVNTIDAEFLPHPV